MYQIEWSKEDLDILIEIETGCLKNPERSYRLSNDLARKQLHVFAYIKQGDSWMKYELMPYSKYLMFIRQEVIFNLTHGNNLKSQFAFHPPNYKTLKEFDELMVNEYLKKKEEALG